MSTSLGDERGQCQANMYIGLLWHAKAEYAKATSYFREAFSLASKLQLQAESEAAAIHLGVGQGMLSM